MLCCCWGTNLQTTTLTWGGLPVIKYHIAWSIRCKCKEETNKHWVSTIGGGIVLVVNAKTAISEGKRSLERFVSLEKFVYCTKGEHWTQCRERWKDKTYRFAFSRWFDFNLIFPKLEDDISMLPSQLHGLEGFITGLRHFVGHLNFVLKIQRFSTGLQVVFGYALTGHILDINAILVDWIFANTGDF